MKIFEVKFPYEDLDYAKGMIGMVRAPLLYYEESQKDTYFIDGDKFSSLFVREGKNERGLIEKTRRTSITGVISIMNNLRIGKDSELRKMKGILTITNGFKGRVEKSRYVYRAEHALICLDSVKDLGNFIKISAYVRDPDEKAYSELGKICLEYARIFGRDVGDLTKYSYLDLLEQKRKEKKDPELTKEEKRRQDIEFAFVEEERRKEEKIERLLKNFDPDKEPNN